ncbi:MAG: hypothetical protein P8Q36_16380 [Alphaproteobacteria bacterium]|nr:hypothetical protein [Rhodospirillaceae bacterium]MBT7613141.1 hypothetical protein [Rhodospirillaceae bacterium]MDG2482424.1 hypothetical protein [Alphaproteobacteria bacterium]
MRSLSYVLLSAFLVVLAGCATVVGGTTQSVALKTQPDGASCVLEREGVVIVTVRATPETVEIERASSPIRMVCSKARHLDASRVVLSGFEGFAAGDLVFGGLVGIVIDASSGAANRYPSEISVMLPPANFDSQAERDTFFDILKADAEYRGGQAHDAATADALCRKNPEGQDCVALLGEIENGRVQEQTLLEEQRLSATIGDQV